MNLYSQWRNHFYGLHAEVGGFSPLIIDGGRLEYYGEMGIKYYPWDNFFFVGVVGGYAYERFYGEFDVGVEFVFFDWLFWQGYFEFTWKEIGNGGYSWLLIGTQIGVAF